MKRFKSSLTVCALFLFFMIIQNSSVSAQTASKADAGLDRQSLYREIESLAGTKGQYIENEGIFKVGFPREDLNVEISGVRMNPVMGLSVWAGFKIIGKEAIVMGDLVLLEDQINPVMSVALDNGLEVTAIHNHFIWDSPKVMFMHVGGVGDPAGLAAAIGKVFAKIKETENGKGEKPYAKIGPRDTTLDPKKIDGIIGAKGRLSSGVYKIVIGRTTTMHGHEMGNAMGVNTWAAFVGNDDMAVVDGDFAMLESEVQDVLKALRKAKINIVALHNHMLMESPRIVFLHFWGVGSTEDLAKGLKSALDTQAATK